MLIRRLQRYKYLMVYKTGVEISECTGNEYG